MNSAALRFVPVDRLAAEGYGELLSLFDDEQAASEVPGEADRGGGGRLRAIDKRSSLEPTQKSDEPRGGRGSPRAWGRP